MKDFKQTTKMSAQGSHYKAGGKVKKYETGGPVLKSDSSGSLSNDDLRNFLKESTSRPLPETSNPELAKQYKQIREQSTRAIKGPSGGGGGNGGAADLDMEGMLMRKPNPALKKGGKVKRGKK